MTFSTSSSDVRTRPWLAGRLASNLVSGAAAVALCTSAPAAAAQGFGLNEIGTCATARGFAATGTPCDDASVIYWNPAAAAEQKSGMVTVGAANVNIQGGFTQDSTGIRYPGNVPPAMVPHFFINGRLQKFALGLGIYAPYGLTSQWGGDFPGRFSALKASLATVYIQPNLAYPIAPNWTIGGGPVFGHSQVELIQDVDLSQQVAAVNNGVPVTFGQLGIAGQTAFATARLKGSATAVGFNAGIHGRFGNWSLGGRYLSALTFHYNGARATFQQLSTGLILPQNNPVDPKGNPVPVDVLLAGQFIGNGALSSQYATSRITDPWQAQAGIGYTGWTGSVIDVDVVRIGWSKFGQLPVTFQGNAAPNSKVLLENYNDTWSYRFGAEHTVQSAGMLQGWTGRVGYSFAQTPAPSQTVTPLLPDMNRRNFSVGLGVPFGDKLKLDAGYVYVNTPGRRGRIVERTSPVQTAADLNSGVYDLKANVFSLTLNANF